MPELVLIGGMPAGGKSTITKRFTDAGFHRMNRDVEGGTVDGLIPTAEALLSAGKSVVMDNLYGTRASRASALKLAARTKAETRFFHVDSSLEDAQFNACVRM